jgi:glycosyltransferase involved in cell wall biosynthesis
VSSRVLFVAYHFPPIGGAGTQRPLKFVRYLPSLGFEPAVLTGPGSTGGRWSPADDSFAREVPPGVPVIRVPGPEPPPTTGIDRVRRLCLLRSRWEEWWSRQVQAAVGPEDFDVIWATGPPYATLEAAALLAVRSKRPWIADLRDLWAFDEMAIYTSAIHRRHERRRMERTLAGAAAIVTTAPTATAALKKNLPSLASRTVTITNGFDPIDFAVTSTRRSPDRFRIVHTGYLHTDAGLKQGRLSRRLLGGGARGVQILTRSHVYLLRAVEKLLAQDPSLGERLEVCLAGVLSSADQEIAARSPITRILGYLPHTESIALMRSADLLFLPMQNKPGNSRSTTIPGKTFEYLASGRPILAAVPAGDARDLLVEAGADVCSPDDTDGMARAIRRRLDMHLVDGPGELDAKEVVRPFERSRLAWSLAAILKDVLDGQAPEPRVA